MIRVGDDLRNQKDILMTDTTNKPSMSLFWGCFIALIATAFAFFTRMYLCEVRFASDFNIDKGTVGVLMGAGVWPFAISIIIWSLFIDKVGYRAAMIFSFVCYVIYVTMACMAYGAIQGVEGEALVAAQKKGYDLLYFGSVILALGNGTVEAFINPVVATMFSKAKTKWLNILHAGWPGGLVLAGLITIAMADIAEKGDWRLVIGVIAIPAVIYLVMLMKAKFPVNEREAAGVSYREMLGELGAFGALVAFGLIFAQLGQVFGWSLEISIGLAVAVSIAFGVYTKSLGRGFMAAVIIIMMPLATTEIGTDGWISGLMAVPMQEAGLNAGWVLVYTSAIMTVLRFFAGPIVHKLSPIGLLVISSVLAIAGLLALSQTGNSGLLVIFAAATLYGFGKTFFWPTMLGVTAEQCPKGGALTLNAISGIGMIAVGILGFPFIGVLQEKTASTNLQSSVPEVAQSVLIDKEGILGAYQAIDPEKAAALTDDAALAAIASANQSGQFTALGKMAMFPAFMLVCYLLMFFYFKSKGGYKAQVLAGHEAEDGKFTGGVEGPAGE
ncbi:MAG: MFS transporter [Verrucomicrobiota bacterium]